MKLIDQSCRNHVCFNVLGVCASDQLGRCMSHPTGFTSKRGESATVLQASLNGRCSDRMQASLNRRCNTVDVKASLNRRCTVDGQHGSPMLPVGLFFRKTCMHPRVQYIAMQPVYWLEIRNYMYMVKRPLCQLTVQQSLNSQKFGDSFWRITVRCYIPTRCIYI